MENIKTVELKRDCDAIQIPIGNTVTIPAGTPADVTQSLGGSYTIRTAYGLFRISAEDADALGLEPQTQSLKEAVASRPTHSEGPLNQERVWEVLKTCYDPEIPVNIVDLGLVYDLSIQPIASGSHRVAVKMTLTAPGCGMGPTIARDVQEKLLYLPGVEEAEVEVVWDPPWHQSMISPAGRARLGLE